MYSTINQFLVSKDLTKNLSECNCTSCSDMKMFLGNVVFCLRYKGVEQAKQYLLIAGIIETKA